MPNNSLPEEPTEVIEELQRKSVPQTPAVQHQVAHSTHQAAASAVPQFVQADSGEIHNREDALTIKFAIGKLNDYIQWFLMVLEAILIIRFVLKMFGADPNNYFASFIFALTQILLVPFDNIIPPVSLHNNQAFEFSTLFAMGIYFLFFFALKRFLRILISNPGESE
jgi:uncharacterized protein YggT (Ycf19 family)